MAQKTYRVEIYDKNFATKLTTVVFPIIRNLTIRLNDITTALWEIPKESPQAIEAYLTEMNKIKILRWSDESQNHVPIWAGSIESIKEGDDTLQIGCIHILDVLDNRLTGADENVNGVAPDEIYDLLSTANTADDTGISEGASDITDSVNFTYNRKSLYDVIHGIVNDELSYEYEIDPDTLELNLMTTIGEDQSTSVVFIRNDDNPNATNVSEAKMQSEGKEIFNYIIGQGKTSGGSVIANQIAYDTDSITAKGRREKTVTFDEARDASQLLSLTQEYLAAHKDALVDLDIVPEPARTVTNVAGDEVRKGYDFFDDYSVGDLVAVKYITRFKEVERTERVVEVKISVDDASNEDIQIKTTDEDQKVIAEIATRTAEEKLADRVQTLENETYS